MITNISKTKVIEKPVKYPCLMRVTNAFKESCIVLFTDAQRGMVVHLETESAPWGVGTYYSCWSTNPPNETINEKVTLQNS